MTAKIRQTKARGINARTGGEGTSTGGAEAVTGLTVLAVEVLSVLTGDGTPGSLQAEDIECCDQGNEVMTPNSICNKHSRPPRDLWIWQSFKARN